MGIYTVVKTEQIFEAIVRSSNRNISLEPQESDFVDMLPNDISPK